MLCGLFPGPKRSKWLYLGTKCFVDTCHLATSVVSIEELILVLHKIVSVKPLKANLKAKFVSVYSHAMQKKYTFSTWHAVRDTKQQIRQSLQIHNCNRS